MSYGASSLLAGGELIEVRFDLVTASESANRLDAEVSPPLLPSSSDQSDASGFILASLEINRETGEISEASFNGGAIDLTAVTFEAALTVFGNTLASYSIASTELGGRVFTSNPPSELSNGFSPARDHVFIVESGSFSGEIVPDTGPIAFDFAQQPVFREGPEDGSVSISATPNSELSNDETSVFDLSLALPLDLSDTANDGSVAVDFTIQGTIQATAQTTLSLSETSPYTTWLETQSLPSLPFSDFDFNPSLPNGLIWALGYEPSPQIELFDTSPLLALQPATTGTQHEISILHTTNLADPDSWELAPVSLLSGVSENPVSAGTNSTIELQQNGTRIFYRFQVNEP